LCWFKFRIGKCLPYGRCGSGAGNLRPDQSGKRGINMKTIMHIAQAPGGVERYLCTLLKKMNKKEFENILVLSQDYDLGKFEKFSNRIECVKMHREINPINEIKAIIQVRRLIKRYNPDIIYMHSSKAGVIGRIANLGIKNVSIYNAHGWAFNMKCNPIKQNLYALIEKMLAPFCTKIVAISDFEKESALKRHICKNEKIQVIFNGIDFDEYNVKKEESDTDNLSIPKNAFVVGSVGRLSRQKAPDIFIKAARLIKNEVPNAFFIMVGDGDEQKECENLILKYGLSESFRITGWVENPLDYIRKFDVAMLLSRWEGFGLVLPEYMLEEKPIVATRVDAIPNIIKDSDNGLLVDIENYHMAAQAVLKIYNDQDFTDKLTKNALNCVKKRFNAERVARETESLFFYCLDNGDVVDAKKRKNNRH
jgi:glycosyltransferase involved in cell wall biosynthesis